MESPAGEVPPDGSDPWCEPRPRAPRGTIFLDVLHVHGHSREAAGRDHDLLRAAGRVEGRRSRAVVPEHPLLTRDDRSPQERCVRVKLAVAGHVSQDEPPIGDGHHPAERRDPSPFDRPDGDVLRPALVLHRDHSPDLLPDGLVPYTVALVHPGDRRRREEQHRRLCLVRDGRRGGGCREGDEQEGEEELGHRAPHLSPRVNDFRTNDSVPLWSW